MLLLQCVWLVLACGLVKANFAAPRSGRFLQIFVQIFKYLFRYFDGCYQYLTNISCRYLDGWSQISCSGLTLTLLFVLIPETQTNLNFYYIGYLPMKLSEEALSDHRKLPWDAWRRVLMNTAPIPRCNSRFFIWSLEDDMKRLGGCTPTTCVPCRDASFSLILLLR